MKSTKNNFKVGDIVIVTERYERNDSYPGMIAKIKKMDSSNVAYCVIDFLKLYNWPGNFDWCTDVREPTQQELVRFGLLKEYNYEIY